MSVFKNKELARYFAIIVTLVMSIVVPLEVSAEEEVVLPTDAVEQDIVAVDLPSLQEGDESLFDFIIDPQHLIFETNAEAYGGGVVEEGANLLFHNRAEEEYTFSRYSDKLTVTNRSTVPVMVTISAGITDVDNIEMVQDKNFTEDGSPYVYLALVDDEGNEQPVSEEGEISMSVRMQRAPESAYVYTQDPETGDYEYGLSQAMEDIDFDTYSFGLTGECSSEVDWESLSVHPKITITWHVEPILTEEGSEAEEGTEEKRQLRPRLDENIASETEENEEIKTEDISGKDAVNKDIVDSADEDAINEGTEGVMDENDAEEDIVNKDATKEEFFSSYVQ